jgi:hypothetical protein
VINVPKFLKVTSVGMPFSQSKKRLPEEHADFSEYKIVF